MITRIHTKDNAAKDEDRVLQEDDKGLPNTRHYRFYKSDLRVENWRASRDRTPPDRASRDRASRDRESRDRSSRDRRMEGRVQGEVRFGA